LGRQEATLLFHAQDLADVGALDSSSLVGAIVAVCWPKEARRAHLDRAGRGPLLRAGGGRSGAADDPGGPADHFMTHLSITEAVGGDERPEAN